MRQRNEIDFEQRLSKLPPKAPLPAFETKKKKKKKKNKGGKTKAETSIEMEFYEAMASHAC